MRVVERLPPWGETQRRRLQREGENPVPHYWDHALWVWGQDSMNDFEKLWDRITLDGVVEHITVRHLITHGANDRQIPVADAHRSYEQATASPKRELKIFTSTRAASNTSTPTTNPTPPASPPTGSPRPSAPPQPDGRGPGAYGVMWRPTRRDAMPQIDISTDSLTRQKDYQGASLE